MWTAEAERRSPRIVRERWCGHWLSMLSEGVTAFDGKPLFKMLHADRCREVIRKGWCQICLSDLPDTVIAVNQGQADVGRPLISDGLPMCPRCALEAFESCPGMQRQQQQGALHFWATKAGYWLQAPVLLGCVPESEGGDERVNDLLARQPCRVFTGPKLVLAAAVDVSLLDLRSMASR
jgi:hypothetical protein